MTESLAIIPRSVEELESLAERLAKSTLIPAAMRDKMPNVLVTIMAGQEMGLAPMAALRSIHVIEGKPVLAADAMMAVVLGSGKAEYFTRVEESDTRVTYETQRKGDPTPRRCTWTIDMAKRAALHLKDNWRGYPRAMLASRAKSELARDVYPDVLAGVFTQDEIESERAFAPPTVHADVIDAEVVSETPSPPEPAIFAEIDKATTRAQLEALAPTLAKLTDAEKARAKSRYKERLGWIKQYGEAAPAPAATAPGPGEPNGLDCSVCGEAQFTVPGGDTCANGHGGADGVVPATEPAP